jgi:hypothetical protein
VVVEQPEPVHRTRARIRAMSRDSPESKSPRPSTLRDWRDQLPAQRRADTVLVGLTDAEFAAGMHRLDEAIADDESPAPVGLDLLWFR